MSPGAGQNRMVVSPAPQPTASPAPQPVSLQAVRDSQDDASSAAVKPRPNLRVVIPSKESTPQVGEFNSHTTLFTLSLDSHL